MQKTKEQSAKKKRGASEAFGGWDMVDPKKDETVVTSFFSASDVRMIVSLVVSSVSPIFLN